MVNLLKHVPERIQKYVMGVLITLSFASPVLAYSIGLPIFDLWSVFVEQIFGGFWLSIFALMIIIAVILAIGGISAFTIFYYEGIFLYAMVVGYGYNIITIPLFALMMFWSIIQIGRLINSSNY